jgi:flagellar hook-length control protein FliK
MMASLNQAPAQTGIASILAAIGTAAPATGTPEEGGFEQLFASLPTASAAATGTAPATANPFAVQLNGQPVATAPVAAEALPAPDAAVLPAPAATPVPPAAALFGLRQPGIDMPAEAAMPEPLTIKTPAPAAKPEAAPATEAAAAAASLLIAAATPFKAAAPVADKPAPVAEADAEAATDGEPAAPAAAQPAAEIVAAPAALVIVSPAAPAAAKPIAEKAAKSAAPAAPRLTDANAAASPPIAVAKPEAAPPQQPAAAFAAIEPKAAKPVADAAASMTVLFAQPDVQGAAPLAEAAKAAPVAERVLDMTSDDQWIAQLAADIAATKSDKGEISFRLMPRHLGRLDVSMLSGDEGVTVRLDTQHEATATIVQAARPRLVEDLRQQGVRIAEAQVTHTPAETGRQQQNQGQGRSSAPDASHLIETAAEQADPTHDERTADRRGRFA